MICNSDTNRIKILPLRSNYTPPDPEQICPRDYPRASLTSLQVRILSRLRDRPPSYESHHSYDERIQREQENQLAVDASIRERGLNANEFDLSGGRAPPCYDSGLVSVKKNLRFYLLFVYTYLIINIVL